FGEAQEAAAEEVEVALRPAVIEGEGDFAGLTGGVPGLFPLPTQKNPAAELQQNGTAAAAGSIFFALIFNVLLFVAAPLLLTNAIFIATGWASTPSAQNAAATTQSSNVVATTKNAAGQSTDEAWYARSWRNVRTYLHPVRPSVAFNLIDGLIRMTFFLI